MRGKTSYDPKNAQQLNFWDEKYFATYT